HVDLLDAQRRRRRAVDVNRATVGGPLERDVVGLHSGPQTRFARLGRIDGDPAVRPGRHDPLAVRRHDFEANADSLGSDGTGLSVGDVLNEEPRAVPRLVAGKEDPAPVRKPGRRLDQDVGPRERFWLPGAGGEERELRVLLTLPPRRQDPAPIWREAPGPSISDADGGRAVELAQVDALRLDVLLFEEDRLPVGGDALGKRPVEPGEIALDSVGCGNAHDLAAGGLHGAENAPVARDVPGGSRGNVPERPGLARKRSRRDAVASARPDFVASRRPREPGDRERAG